MNSSNADVIYFNECDTHRFANIRRFLGDRYVARSRGYDANVRLILMIFLRRNRVDGKCIRKRISPPILGNFFSKAFIFSPDSLVIKTGSFDLESFSAMPTNLFCCFVFPINYLSQAQSETAAMVDHGISHPVNRSDVFKCKR